MVRKISRLLLHQISSEIWFTKSLLIFRTTKYQNYKATLMGTGTTENNICSHIFQDSKFSLHTRWFSHDSAIAICLFSRFPHNVQNHAIVTNQHILSFLILNMYMCNAPCYYIDYIYPYRELCARLESFEQIKFVCMCDGWLQST